LLWSIGAASYGQPAGDALYPSSQVEQKIRAALDGETSIEFIESPLQDICDYLADFHQITIQIDGKALDEEGLGPDVPITGNLRGVSLRSALNLLMAQHDLAWAVRDEAVLITTAVAARAHPIVQVYNVADLIPDGSNSEDLVQALDSVLRCHQSENATPGIRIAAYQQLILFAGPEQKQYELKALLGQIRAGIHGATHATPAVRPQATQQEPAKASKSKPPAPFGGDADPFGKPHRPATSRAEDPFAPSKDGRTRGGAAKKSSAEPDDPFGE